MSTGIKIDYENLKRITGQSSIDEIPRNTKILVSYISFGIIDSKEIHLVTYMAEVRCEPVKKKFIDHILFLTPYEIKNNFYLYDKYTVGGVSKVENIPDFWQPLPELDFSEPIEKSPIGFKIDNTKE